MQTNMLINGLLIQGADQAFNSWRETTPADRATLLLSLADKIDAQAEAFAKL
jgi:aminobutyraldehyde dehydrogenase